MDKRMTSIPIVLLFCTILIGVPSLVYAKIQAGAFPASRKMVILK